MKKPRPIRILSVSDFHCGNLVGLTPEEFNPKTEVDHKQYVYRRGLNEWVRKEVDKLRPIDICVADGDLVDGKGPKSGGNELIVTDTNKQAKMAIDFLKFVDAKEYRFTVGTAYHTGGEDDREVQIADEFNAPLEDVATISPGNLVMRWRHHLNGSQVPSGRATSLLRQQEWDILWSVNGEFQRADVYIFGHNHYFISVTNRFGTVFIQPALQGLGGSQLGSRRLGGVVDFGFLHFDVLGKGDWKWEAHTLIQTRKVRSGVV